MQPMTCTAIVDMQSVRSTVRPSANSNDDDYRFIERQNKLNDWLFHRHFIFRCQDEPWLRSGVRDNRVVDGFCS